jgi:hypothetical protein
VAAGEDQPQPVVADRFRFWALDRLFMAAARHGDIQGPERRVGPHQQRELGRQRGPAPDEVERGAPGDGGEPGAGAVGHPVALPGAQGLDVGVLHHLLGRFEVAGDAHRRGEHVGPLAAVRIGDGLLDGGQ